MCWKLPQPLALATPGRLRAWPRGSGRRTPNAKSENRLNEACRRIAQRGTEFATRSGHSPGSAHRQRAREPAPMDSSRSESLDLIAVEDDWPPAEPATLLPEPMRGRLETLDLLNLVKLLSIQGKSGELTLEGETSVDLALAGETSDEPLPAGESSASAWSRQAAGRVSFDDGEIVAAASGERRGPAALTELLSLARGSFRFDAGRPSAERNVSRRAWLLLLEKLLQREANRIRERGEPRPPAHAASSAVTADGLLTPHEIEEVIGGTDWPRSAGSKARRLGSPHVGAVRRRLAAAGARLRTGLYASSEKLTRGLTGWRSLRTPQAYSPLLRPAQVGGRFVSAAKASWQVLRRPRPLPRLVPPATMGVAAAGAVALLLAGATTLVLSHSGEEPPQPLESSAIRSLRLRNAENRVKLDNLQHLVRDLSSSIATGMVTGQTGSGEEGSVVATETSATGTSALAPILRGSAESRTGPARPGDLARSAADGRLASDLAALRNAPVERALDVRPSLAATRYPHGMVERKTRRLDIFLTWTDKYLERARIPPARFWVLVNASGGVEEVRLANASGLPELDRLAAAALRTASYRPARKGGAAVPAWIRQEVLFRNR